MIRLGIAAVGLMVLSACNGGGGGGGGSGTLTIEATDAPFVHGIVDEAWVDVSAIRIHSDAAADMGFLTLYSGAPIRLDLLKLRNGVTKQLVTADLPSGSYGQLRLVFSAGYLRLENGNEYSTANGDLHFTSQGTSGQKVFISPPLQVTDGVARTVLLDFDLTKTFHPIPASDPLNANTYSLHPVLRVANLSTAGEIRGTVTGDDGTGQLAAVDKATVYVVSPGEDDVANAIATTATEFDGTYAILGLPPGTYDVLASDGARSARSDGEVVLAGSLTVVDLVLTP